MATILIVEDRPNDRALLTATLQTGGHQIVQASDGEEALELLSQINPDLVISDILMPTLDGHEFVRRMRERATRPATPVIFYAAPYHVREARTLAARCGVFEVLTKADAPQSIVAAVDAALGSRVPAPGARIVATDLGREPGKADTWAPTGVIDDGDAETERMKAVLEVAEQIAVQRTALDVINTVCVEARHATLARHAVVGLLTDEGSTGDLLYTSGFDAATAVSVKPPSIGAALLTDVVRERRPVRTRNLDGRPEVLGLPADHPTVSSLLSVPIATSSRVYGWLSLWNKLGTDQFTEIDERVAVTLGVHAGIAYEGAHRSDDLHRRVDTLEQELRRTSARITEQERARLSRMLHDWMGQMLVGLKIDAHWVARQLVPGAESSTSAIGDRVASILKRLDETIGWVRTIATELRPPVMDQLGLVAAIEWQTGQFERRFGIRCRVRSQIDEFYLDPRRATALFLILQEALTNVLQHAHATRATVTVRRLTGSLIVSVADNGRGIADRDLANPGSLGVIGMRERSAILGGTVTLGRRRTRGTVVTVTVPLPREPGDRRGRS